MKREMGKWLMDVAKYMNTIIISVSLVVFATIVGVYYMYHDKKQDLQNLTK